MTICRNDGGHWWPVHFVCSFFSRPAAIFPRVPLGFDGNTVLGDGMVAKVAPLDYLESKV